MISRSPREDGIRRRIGTDNLIGCFTIDKNGRTFFTDIRGEEGDRVNISGIEELEIDYSGPHLKEGEFYTFSWHLEGEDNFIIDSTPIIVANNDFLNRLYNARLKLSGNNLETFNNFQKTVFDEVTGAQHTYIYELLQNANDYPYNGEKVKVNFILTNNYLFFTHTGASFNLRNVVGITSINQGEKKKNIDTIGYKGIGFKTVFVNNEYVYLNSGGWSFRFDKEYSEIQFAGECPWSLMPIPTDKTELDKELIGALDKLGSDMRVQFALKHKNNASLNLPQLKKVFDDNQILLFIPNVGSVEVIADGYKKSVIKDENAWIVSDFTFPVSQELKQWVIDNIDNGNKVPEKFKDIEKVKISFAVQKDGDQIVPVEEARVYNYLPTELRLGFKFLINADFIPNGSRSGLHDVDWNDQVMEQAGVKFAEWWASLMADEKGYDINSVFQILPPFESNDRYGKDFLKGFFKRIKEIPCVPTLKDGDYRLCKINEILQDRIDFFNGDEIIITDEDFYKYYSTNLFLPHPSLRNDGSYIRFIRQFGPQENYFNGISLEKLINNSEFCENWLKLTSNNIHFNGYLISSEFIINVRNRGIFLNNEGKLGIASKLYPDLDEYIQDLYFMEDLLPRLNDEVREGLSHYKNWDSFEKSFLRFEPNRFARDIIDNFGSYKEWFETIEESKNFIHFLSVTHYQGKIPFNFPLYNQEDNLVKNKSELFQENEFGWSLREKAWINKEWIQFLNPGYFERDNDLVSKFLSDQNIKKLNPDEAYRLIINNRERIPSIASKIKEKSISVDFYRYLWINESPNFSQEMRAEYSVISTDGKNEEWIPIKDLIFKQDEEWRNLISKEWMPERCCWGLCNLYYENLSNEEIPKFESFLGQKNIIQRCTVEGLFNFLSYSKRFNEIFSKINTLDLSCDFIVFLWDNNKVTHPYIQRGNLKDLPVMILGQEDLMPLSNFDKVYIPSKELLDLYNQPWFDKSQINILNEKYGEIIYGDRIAFCSGLGITKFRLVEYVKENILPNLDSLKESLKDRDNNITFHRFFSTIHNELSEKEMEPLRQVPIYLSSPFNESGELCEISEDHYLPSPMLTEIIRLDIVPREIMDSIHPDYIQNEQDKKYFETILGNTIIDLSGFIQYIVKRKEEVALYLQDDDRNIKFWNWVSENVEDTTLIKSLSDFPILDKGGNFELASQIYISNSYTDTDIESFINRYVNNAKFISDKYQEFNDEIQWTALFSHIGLNVSSKEILFKDVVPNLKFFKDNNIIFELSKNLSFIKTHLDEKDEKLKKQLSELQILCIDDNYRIPNEIIVTGKYFDIEKETYPDIKISYIASEVYIEDCHNNDNLRRQIIDFFKFLGDTYDSKCETSTSLRRAKLEFYSKHQNSYLKDDSHYRIISELAKDYNEDSVGIKSIIENLDKIYLLNEENEPKYADLLYLGSLYGPKCDFQKYGIKEISYVNNKYQEFGSHLATLFRKLGTKDVFTKDNLSLLINEDFAEYFWTDYLRTHFSELEEFLTSDVMKDLACIPTFEGVKKPKELYYTSNPRLNKVIAALPKGQFKQPRIQIPDYLRIGLRVRLSIEDSLQYLKIETLDYRQDVLEWIYEDIKNIDPIRQKGFLEYIKRLRDEFVDTATWFTGSKKWKPIKELVALEWADGRSQLKDNFGGNAYICNPSNMPETKQIYDKICDFFNIKILTDKDFHKKKDGIYGIDAKARNEIDKRLLYIAYQIENKKWKQLYEEMHKQLFEVDLSKCERILYFYNENISSDEMYSYIDDPKKLWYVGQWDGKRFQKILEWVLNTFQLKKHGFSILSLEKMFEMPVNQYLKRNEGGVMPPEFLSMLDEADKAGLEIDKYANYEEGIDSDNYNTSSLSEEIIEKGRLEREKRRESNKENNLEKKNSEVDIKESDKTTSQKSLSKDKENHAQKESREQSGNQRPRTTSPSNNGTSPNNPKLQSQNENTSEEPTLEEKMEKKWEEQRKKGIHRPQGAGYSSKEEPLDIDLKSKTTNTSENPEFFSGRTWSQTSRNSNRDKSSEEIQKRHTEAQNNVENASQQLGLYEIWQETDKYTFKWFKYLMELQFQEKDKKLPVPVQIDFHDWTTMDAEQKRLRVIAPSRNIPKWLEDAQDYKVTLLGTSSKVLECSILSVDGEGIDLLINPNDLDLINSFEKIRINAQNHTNFIDSLQTSFLELDLEDDYKMDDNLPDEIKFIYGPPGTGKTTRLVEIISGLLANPIEDKINILILTPTNKAADVIAEKLYDDKVCHNYISRFGYTDCSKLISGEDNCFENRDTMYLDSREHNIMVTTMARYAYDTIQPDSLPISDIDWDYIIIDEASMIDIVPITYVLHKGRNSKFIIAGDPKQITPIPQHNMPAYNIYNMVGLDSFKEALNGKHRFPIEGLTTQHRSIPVIGDLVSKFCYQGLVKNDPMRTIPKPLNLDGINVKSLNFIGFKVQEMDMLYELSQINDSAFHLYSAIFGYNFVKYIVDQIGAKYSDNYSIGVVCPYKAQSDAIQQLLDNKPLSNDQCEIVCGTVHKFQGDECDIMILILNPPPRTYSGSHINNENIINVAMSRAKDYIFFLMPEKEEDGYDVKDRLGSIIDNKDRTIHFCGNIEKVLFNGNSDYIYDNTSIQCHQAVNVFYDNRAKYEVRISDTALDIQIND